MSRTARAPQIAAPYAADRERAEGIVLEAAARHSIELRELSNAALHEMKRRYFMQSADVTPRVYGCLTDNWLEMTVRFIAHARIPRTRHADRHARVS